MSSQVISSYSYDENDKLNKEVSDYILDKTKHIPFSKKVKLNFHTTTKIDKENLQNLLTTQITFAIIGA